METRDGVTLPAYRGDAVNGYDFTPESRIPDPQRLVDVYNSSAATLNLVRAFVTGGYADLRQVHTWNTDFVQSSPFGQRYEAMADEIERALTFMKAIGADPDEFHRVDFHSSHEALLLEYEHSLTRIDSRTDLPYNVSAHFVWIGERTRQLDGAHVELLSKIQNPIGIKLGPTTTPDDALAYAARLNPDNKPGRLTFITRFGAGKIRDGLPPLVEKVTAEGVQVAWVCDPMHGNTFEASSGYKTRRFDDVIEEVQGFFDVHRASAPGPAASTSSSPVTTSPSASAAARRSTRPAWPTATSRSATRGSTGSSRSSSRSSSPRCCARPERRPRRRRTSGAGATFRVAGMWLDHRCRGESSYERCVGRVSCAQNPPHTPPAGESSYAAPAGGV